MNAQPSIFWQRWDAWWCRESPPQTMAVVRIILGIYLFIYIARYAGRAPLMFSSSGMAIPLFYGPNGTAVTVALFTLLLLACLALAAGIWMRASVALVILLGLHFWQLNVHLFPATIHRILLLLLCIMFLSGSDRTFSLRSWLRHGSLTHAEPISILPQRLIAVTMTAIYLGAGWQKFALPAWDSGELLAYSLISSWATPLGFALIRLNIPIAFYDASTEGIKFFFFLLPFALWIPRARLYAFAGGALFHILVAVLLSIWSFLIMIPLYIVFLEPEEVEKRLHNK